MFTVAAERSGARLDQFLASLMPDYSRARLQDWIEAGGCEWTDPKKASYKLREGERVEVEPLN